MSKPTQSSKLIGISFPNELAQKLAQKALETNKSFPWIVRHACMLMLQHDGEDVSGIVNSEGRGSRSDVKRNLILAAKPSEFPVDPKIIENALKNGVPESSRRPKSVKRKTG